MIAVYVPSSSQLFQTKRFFAAAERTDSERDEELGSAYEISGGGFEDGGNGSTGRDDFGDADGDFGGADEDFGGADDEPGPGPREDIGGASGIGNLMERIEATVCLSGRDADAGDEYSVEGGGDVEWGSEVDDEGYDDFQGDIDNEGAPRQEPDELFLPPEDGGDASSALPRLDMLHMMAPSFASSTTVEGGPEKLRHNTKAAGSPFYPFATKEQQLLFLWLHVHRISQRALGGLLEVLSTVYEGEPFDVKGLAGVNPEHFYSRMRPYLPLLQLVKRDVPSAHDETASSAVFDIPVNLLLHRTMQIESETGLSETHPGGKLLRGEEIEANCLTSEHINCVPTRREGNVMNSNHNGVLAKSSPFFGFDGIRATTCGRKVYVNDCCVCDVGGVLTLCRLLEIFYDDVRRLVLVTVRLFRTVAEMRDVGEEERRGCLLRVWEDCTPGSRVELEATNVLGLVEMESPQNSNGGDGHSFPWDRFFAEGFATAAGTKRRHHSDAMLKSFKVLGSPWHAEGRADKPLFGVRHQGVHVNDMNLPFYSAPVVFSCDAFNAWGLGNKVRIVGWSSVSSKADISGVDTVRGRGVCIEARTLYLSARHDRSMVQTFACSSVSAYVHVHGTCFSAAFHWGLLLLLGLAKPSGATIKESDARRDARESRSMQSRGEWSTVRNTWTATARMSRAAHPPRRARRGSGGRGTVDTHRDQCRSIQYYRVDVGISSCPSM